MQPKSNFQIINDTDFAFLNHDLTKGQDSTTTSYATGDGNYTYNNRNYNEQLDVLICPVFEGNSIESTLELKRGHFNTTGH